ncbi:MAG: hypothetical protein PHT25_01915 [Bacteroidales bacterium]|nr:hypothetical protein [Bacteroidales bacterium]
MEKYLIILALQLLLIGCGKKIYRIERNDVSINVRHEDKRYKNTISLSDNKKRELSFTEPNSGRSLLLENAARDETSGEMIGVRELEAVIVTAKSENISERNGIILLGFIITVPSTILDNKWQLEILPVLSIGLDTLHFSSVAITGIEFKKAQNKGYLKYEKYLRRIIPDEADFYEFYTDLPNLVLFLERNLPESRILEGINNDKLTSEFGISEREIVDHYVRNWLIERNEKRKREKDLYFNKYVRNPIIRGCRLDSVIKGINGDFAYHYTQEIVASKESSKLHLNLHGTIRDQSGFTVRLKPSDTLQYNVSSMISFIDTTKRYKQKIVYRRVSSNINASIDFKPGKYNIDPSLSSNLRQLTMIKDTIRNILNSVDLILDSLIITAAASPEGFYTSNKILSSRRAGSIKQYLIDILDTDKDVSYTIKNGLLVPDRNDSIVKGGNLYIVSRSIPEEWSELSRLIQRDENIVEKEKLIDCMEIKNPDERETAMKMYRKDYKYIREHLYPALRRVHFTFHLHKRGMIKDTIHTKEIDTLYQRGVAYLRERRYQEALKILSRYEDFNTAIAHMSLGHDFSAEKILSGCNETAIKVYLQAILAARRDEEEKAVQYFLKSKRMDISMAYRGSLDPEISYLINKYNLNEDLFK